MSTIYLTILFPLIGFFLLTFLKTKISKSLSIFIGISSVSLSFLSVLYLDVFFLKSSSTFLEQKIWTWINFENLKIDFSLLIDPLSLTMITMVTFIGLLIHIFSNWYMSSEKELNRFFSYMNLFIASMLTLLLADNLVFMYLGWEGVGVCSYLLIGFYYNNKQNGISARKAFIITRIGDIFLMLSIFLIYNAFHVLNFEKLILTLKNQTILENQLLFDSISIFLLLAAVSKSAQIPLQTWLADAMVGPTPVSALIHAATMVTAGVYLIVRMLYIFILAPKILTIIGFIGAITLLLASISALFQSNIKRILAYSTMSQIGYMFMALGVQAWSSAIVHLISHAVFKALLFLSAGSIIKICNNEQNIFKMQRLNNEWSLVKISFLVGGLSLISFPIISLGFYSKEEILLRVLDSRHMVLFYAGLLGVLITSLYTFRLIFTILCKNETKIIYKSNNIFHDVPLLILTVFSTFIGFFLAPNLNNFFPSLLIIPSSKKIILEIFSSILAMTGIGISYVLWGNIRYNNIYFYKLKSFLLCSYYWFNRWGFDAFYESIFIKPFLRVSNAVIRDPIKIFFENSFLCFKEFHRILLLSQSGYLRFYMLITINSIVLIITSVLCI